MHSNYYQLLNLEECHHNSRHTLGISEYILGTVFIKISLKTLWNNLPVELRNSASMFLFKKILKCIYWTLCNKKSINNTFNKRLTHELAMHSNQEGGGGGSHFVSLPTLRAPPERVLLHCLNLYRVTINLCYVLLLCSKILNCIWIELNLIR